MMDVLAAAREIQSLYGKPADHPWTECLHPTTQDGGDGCHMFASCHGAYPSRCGFMPHEHYQPGTPELMLPQIVAVLELLQEALEQCEEFSYATRLERMMRGESVPV